MRKRSIKKDETGKHGEATAILTADWHLRLDIPKCRIDDYLAAQYAKIEFILDLAAELHCPIIIAGDLGNKSTWPNELLSIYINLFKSWEINIFTICGQHDLPYHNMNNLKKSGLEVLQTAETISILDEYRLLSGTMIFSFHFGEPITHIDKSDNDPNFKKIAVAHRMVIQDNPLWPGQVAPKANALLKKFPEYDLILTGDNHQTFVEEYKGRLLVNPGSLMRMTADQINHEPMIFVWYAETNTLKSYLLPIQENVMETDYLKEQKRKDKRIENFVKHLKSFEVSLSFEKNLQNLFDKQRTKKKVVEKVWKALG